MTYLTHEMLNTEMSRRYEERMATPTVPERIASRVYVQRPRAFKKGVTNDASEIVGTRFIVTKFTDEGVSFEYYTVKVEIPPNRTIGKFLTAPSVLSNGLLLYRGKFYRISVDDILKRRFCATPVSIQTTQHQLNISESNGDTHDSSSSTGIQQPRASDPSWDEDLQAANLAYERQMLALLAN